MTPLSEQAQTFTWLVDNFVAEVPGVSHAVVVSADGLLVTTSQGMPVERGEQLAAIASGMLSLARSSARLFEHGACEQTIVRMERGYLFLMAVSDGSCLTVLAGGDCDMKVVAYQMALLVENAGHVLTPQLRRELRGALVQ